MGRTRKKPEGCLIDHRLIPLFLDDLNLRRFCDAAFDIYDFLCMPSRSVLEPDPPAHPTSSPTRQAGIDGVDQISEHLVIPDGPPILIWLPVRMLALGTWWHSIDSSLQLSCPNCSVQIGKCLQPMVITRACLPIKVWLEVALTSSGRHSQQSSTTSSPQISTLVAITAILGKVPRLAQIFIIAFDYSLLVGDDAGAESLS